MMEMEAQPQPVPNGNPYEVSFILLFFLGRKKSIIKNLGVSSD